MPHIEGQQKRKNKKYESSLLLYAGFNNYV